MALEMAQRLRLLKVCTALAEDLSSDPSTHLRELTTAYDSGSRGSNTLSLLCRHL